MIRKRIDEENKVVIFRGKYPGVMAIPAVMKEYPGYTYSIISWKEFNERYGEN